MYTLLRGGVSEKHKCKKRSKKNKETLKNVKKSWQKQKTFKNVE